jgi:site-specific recombinase XerD
MLKFSKEEYETYLVDKELSQLTVAKYIRDTEHFFAFLNGRVADFSAMADYKAMLMEKYKSSTVNSYLISLNQYWHWINRDDLCVKLIKCQRTYFTSNEFTIGDYRKITEYAHEHEIKWYLIMRCLGAMGIRVGELKFITYEAVKDGTADVLFKSKLRTIIIPKNLRTSLLDFCENESINTGAVFLNKQKTGPLNSSVIWRNLKRIAEKSGVNKSNVYPHNFRHMFAREYMNTYHNIVELADILGHSSIETTRIYTKSSRESQRKKLEELGL